MVFQTNQIFEYFWNAWKISQFWMPVGAALRIPNVLLKDRIALATQLTPNQQLGILLLVDHRCWSVSARHNWIAGRIPMPFWSLPMSKRLQESASIALAMAAQGDWHKQYPEIDLG